MAQPPATAETAGDGTEAAAQAGGATAQGAGEGEQAAALTAGATDEDEDVAMLSGDKLSLSTVHEILDEKPRRASWMDWMSHKLRMAKQLLQERLGAASATVDKELEGKIAELYTMQASFRNVLRLVVNMNDHMFAMVQVQKEMSACFGELSLHEPALYKEFATNQESQKVLCVPPRPVRWCAPVCTGVRCGRAAGACAAWPDAADTAAVGRDPPHPHPPHDRNGGRAGTGVAKTPEPGSTRTVRAQRGSRLDPSQSMPETPRRHAPRWHAYRCARTPVTLTPVPRTLVARTHLGGTHAHTPLRTLQVQERCVADWCAKLLHGEPGHVCVHHHRGHARLVHRVRDAPGRVRRRKIRP